MTKKEQYCCGRAEYLNETIGISITEGYAIAEKEWDFNHRPPQTFFTADCHFGHLNIIKYDNRPFTCVREMDEEMIRRWNETVAPQDTVYILGDLSWHDDAKTAEILRQLNGKKILIDGNHDNNLGPLSRKEFKETHFGYWEIRDPNHGSLKVIMSHYPMHLYNGQRRGAVMLYGHVHNMLDHEVAKEVKELVEARLGVKSIMINVGCMHWDYRPRTLEELMKGVPE